MPIERILIKEFRRLRLCITWSVAGVWVNPRSNSWDGIVLFPTTAFLKRKDYYKLS